MELAPVMDNRARAAMVAGRRPWSARGCPHRLEERRGGGGERAAGAGAPFFTTPQRIPPARSLRFDPGDQSATPRLDPGGSDVTPVADGAAAPAFSLSGGARSDQGPAEGAVRVVNRGAPATAPCNPSAPRRDSRRCGQPRPDHGGRPAAIAARARLSITAVNSTALREPARVRRLIATTARGPGAEHTPVRSLTGRSRQGSDQPAPHMNPPRC